MSKILILNVKKYDFVNEKNENVKGGKISYLSSTVKAPGNLTGLPIVESKVNFDLADNIKKTELPGYFDMEMDLKVNGKGDPIPFISNLKFVSLATINLDK